MRRIPSGALQKFYKRLYDLWDRYPHRWIDEKGYADADYFNHKMIRLLKDLKAAMSGEPIPGTMPEQRPSRRMPRPDLGYGVEQVRDREGFAHLEDPYGRMRDDEDYTQGQRIPRRITMSPAGSRFVPRKTKSKSRSVKPTFLRRGR